MQTLFVSQKKPHQPIYYGVVLSQSNQQATTPKIAISLSDEQATALLAKRFASAFNQLSAHSRQPLIIYLKGQLGAGKTTFSRHLIQALGHSGSVKSPTYSLMEVYHLEGGQASDNPISDILHLDLYRVVDPEEVEFLGLYDELEQAQLCLIEWPSKAPSEIPKADIILQLEHEQNADLPDQRRMIVDVARPEYLAALDISGLTIINESQSEANPCE